jgi:8-oxo-dGTP pyrophosphatase MutT (NUDIX family)
MKKNENANPWKTLKVKEVYDNPWINVTHRDVINPSGGQGIYGLVHFKNIAIAIVPIDEEGNTYLVGQYRYTIEEYSWEVVEGGGPLGEDPLESAKRELLEETGIKAKTWKKIGEMALSNSVSDEKAIMYVAKDLTFGEAEPEETEQLQVKKVPFEKVFEMTMNGKITDALSVAAILKTKYLIDNGLV